MGKVFYKVLMGLWVLGPTLSYSLPATDACRDFLKYSVLENQTKSGFLTDGLVVQKDGRTLYEYYDADPGFGGNPKTGLYNRETPHSLWSASKSITATLVGRALFEEASRIGLQSRLAEFFGRLPSEKPSHDEFYGQIKIFHLLEMSSGFVWNESYDDDLKDSTFLPMLYLKKGQPDMLRYALSQPLGPEGPRNRWNYSGGNSIMLMGILRKLYGDDAYAQLPWDLLFHELGITSAVFERDPQGTFVGNSYVYLSPIDMVKVGELYLNNGVFRGKRLLDEQWIEDSQKLSPSVANPNTPLPYIKAEGIYSERSFWLNQAVRGYGPEFPNSPRDMYFAAGHYGQLIVILPTQHMVLARTGHDADYWKKIDAFVSKAVACFAPAGGPGAN